MNPLAQSAWSMLLTLSGSYSQLYTYAVFAALVFNGMARAAVFVLRRTHPDHPRPYRAWGYPVVPALFVLVTIYLIIFTIKNAPLQSLIGLAIIAAGLPVYWYFTSKNKDDGAPPAPSPSFDEQA